MVIPKTPPKKTASKNSFRRLIFYIAGGAQGKEKVLFTGTFNLSTNPEGSSVNEKERDLLEEIVDEVELNANDRRHSNCKDPMFHEILSWPTGEQPDEEQIREAVGIYLQEMNLEQCHCFYGVHKNTDNIHVHLCISRVDPENQKVIHAAGGWTKKAGERACRKIELLQGWRQDNGKWYEVIDGEIYEKNGRMVDRSISTKALDFENATSAKSAESIARETCASILFSAKSWNELHQMLAEVGCHYEKKGSGAILFVGETPVKISSISQKLSHKKIEQRLGAFIEKPGQIEIAPRDAEPVILNTNSDSYLKSRRLYFTRKQMMREKLNNQFTREKDELKKKQKEERDKLYKSLPSWKGYGTLLNGLRFELAREHEDEWRAFIQSKKDRRMLLRKEDQIRFPSFTEWLVEKSKYQEALIWKSRKTLTGMILGTQENPFPGLIFNDRKQYYNVCTEYKNTRNKQIRTTCFRDKESGLIAFRDVGSRIEVLENQDRRKLLDAMVLAQRKWGSITLNGTVEFKNKMLELAVANDIEVSNPELKAKYEEIKRRRKEELDRLALEKAKQKVRRDNMSEKSEKIANLFSQYSEAVGAERYRVTCRYIDQNGNERNWIVDKPKGAEVSIGFAPEEVKERSWLLAKLDSEQKTLYYTPLSDKMHHILIDDVTPDKLKQLHEDGYCPAAVIMSSPNNYQCILNVPKLDSRYDKEIGNRLMRELNKTYGDPKISGSVHPHRIPGAHNCKEKHRKEDGTYPEVTLIYAKKRNCTLSLKSTTEMLNEMITTEKEREERIRRTMKQRAVSGKISAYDAYMAHAKDLIGHFGNVSNWSALDAQVAERMYVTGYNLGEIASAITSGSRDVRPESQKNKHNWDAYGKKTAEYLMTPYAQNKISRYGEVYKKRWLWLEGRKESELER